METVEEDILRIMIVDDDEDERDFFTEMISRLPMPHVVYKASGAHSLFLELAKNPLPHIIFLDINMPMTNGIECLQKLKADEQYKHIPVLMYSISNRDKDIEDAYSAGAHYYLVKPHVPANLPPSLRKALMPDWRKPQPVPGRDGFVIDLSYES